MSSINNITLNQHACRYMNISNPEKPALVVLPGNLQEIESIKPFNDGLSNDFDYYAVELPGTGLTEPMHPTYNMEYMSRLLSEFVNHYVEKDISLLACSYATPMALEYAKSNNITQLVLAGSMREIPADRWGDALSLMANSLIDRNQFSEEFISALSVDNDRIPRRKAVLKAAKMKAKKYSDEQFWCFIYNSIRLMSYMPINLEKITCPTLCFTGELDPYVTKELCSQLSSQIPFSQFATVTDSDHLFLIQKPEETTELILNFLKKNITNNHIFMHGSENKEYIAMN